ncbi:hypothetical protein, partial [Papillibacter cinnamivorans]
TAKPNETYYLMDEKKLPTDALLRMTAGDASALDDFAVKQLEAKSGRPVAESWKLAEADGGIGVYLVLYEAKGNDLLASIAVRTPDETISKEYPAQLNGSSAWRVDDGGTLTAKLFNVLFAAKTDTDIYIGMEWIGAEGKNAFILQQNGDALEEADIRFYRYTAIA